MGLFTQEFLTERREEFMGLISKFEYEINGGERWLTATERSRQIDEYGGTCYNDRKYLSSL